MEIIAVCLADRSKHYSERDIQACLNLAGVKFNPYFGRYSGKTPGTNLFFEYESNKEPGEKGTFFYYVSRNTLQERLPLFIKGLKKIFPKMIPDYRGIGLIKRDNSIEISREDQQLEGIIRGIMSPHAN